jgi:Ca2+-binding EF-hand superfamily protein
MNQGIFITSLEKTDLEKKGFISFLNLRKILENVNLDLEDKYIEYLIYVMKSFNDDNTNLDELKYSVFIQSIIILNYLI